MKPTLDAFGDVLTNADLMALLQIKKSAFYAMKAHGLLPDPIPGKSSRYSKASIAGYLANPETVRRARRRVA